MTGNSFKRGDRVEVTQDLGGIKRGMIGYIVSPYTQCEGCVKVRFFWNCLAYEFPASMLCKANSKNGEVFINDLDSLIVIVDE